VKLTIEEAKAIARRVGKAELEFVVSITAPLYWVIRSPDGGVTTRNGSAFFLQTGKALFGVTAAHVIEGKNSWREYCQTHGATPLRLGGRVGTSVPFEWDARAVDINLDLDIATFAVSPREIEAINRTAFSGFQKDWPPDPPEKNEGIAYCGFPGVGTRQLSRAAVEFGAVAGGGIASSISEINVSSHIERDYLEPTLGQGVHPDNFNFGGISGGPMIYMTEKAGLRLSALAGVIFSGPNIAHDLEQAISGFELIRARRARFIMADGFLDHSLWESLRP
jgi:hypothetical protein